MESSIAVFLIRHLVCEPLPMTVVIECLDWFRLHCFPIPSYYVVLPLVARINVLHPLELCVHVLACVRAGVSVCVALLTSGASIGGLFFGCACVSAASVF